MKVLFAALHHAYYRNFESVVRELWRARPPRPPGRRRARESLGGQGLAERLAAEYPGASPGTCCRRSSTSRGSTRRSAMRVSLDYVRVLDPAIRRSCGCVPRSARRASCAGVSSVPGWCARLASRRAEGVRARCCRSAQRSRALPRRERAPDVVVLTSLTYSRSQQLDLLRAARALGIPVAAAIMSWDHLSSKALLHVAPDRS